MKWAINGGSRLSALVIVVLSLCAGACGAQKAMTPSGSGGQGVAGNPGQGSGGSAADAQGGGGGSGQSQGGGGNHGSGGTPATASGGEGGGVGNGSGGNGSGGNGSGGNGSGGNGGVGSGGVGSGGRGGTGGTVATTCQPVLNQAGLDTGFDDCAGGTVRRRAAIVCPLPPMRAPDAGAPPSPSCTADSDCGRGGVCADAHNLAGYSGCFSGCRQDSDCDAGSICWCNPVFGQCIAASCKTNADCAAGLGCVATAQGQGGQCTVMISFPSAPITRFVCQRPDDECASNADCAVKGGSPSGVPDGGAYSSGCFYDGVHRVCGYDCTGPV